MGRLTTKRSRKGELASGARVPLLIPPCVIREWNLNGVTGAERTAAEAEDGTNLGYEFEWGQIIEDRREDRPDDDVPEIPITWDFVLSRLYDESSMRRESGRIGRRGPLLPRGSGVGPEFIAFEDGSSSISAFGVVVHGEASAAAARTWLCEEFVRPLCRGYQASQACESARTTRNRRRAEATLTTRINKVRPRAHGVGLRLLRIA